MNRVGAIIQARTSSTRLPRKVLLSLPYGSNITVLQQVIRRVLKSKKINTVVIATTTDREDDIIIEIAKREGVKTFRGSKEDVLSRYFHCAVEFNFDQIVRITSDCPCIDWNLIDLAVEEHLKVSADYTRLLNIPHGLNVEVISFWALKKAFYEATEYFEREHVTPYIYMRCIEKFKINDMYVDYLSEIKDIRITLDTEEDYALLCAIFDFLYYENESFTADEILKLFKNKPWLSLINKKVIQKKVYYSFEEELEEAIKILELQGLKRIVSILEKWRENI